MKKIVFLLFLSLMVGGTIKAQTISGLSLDSVTTAKGFTVSSRDNDFKVAILPKMIKSGAEVELKNYDYSEMAYTFPANKILASQIYSYDIKTASRSKISVPISLKYFSGNINDLSLYYYDGLKKQWLKITASVNEVEKNISTTLPFYYVQLAIFENSYLREADLNVKINAKAAIVVSEGNDIIFAKEPDLKLPLASLTKLATALTVAEKKPAWNKYLEITEADKSYGSVIPLKTGEQVRLKDLYNAMLISSANDAAKALVRGIGYDPTKYIYVMNKKAANLGLKQTKFTDVAGLFSGCVSTPREYAVLAKEAFNRREITSATTSANYSFYTLASTNHYNINNTNKLLNSDLKILGGKTGYADFVGYNLVLKIEKAGQQYIIVILGAETREASFETAKNLTAIIK